MTCPNRGAQSAMTNPLGQSSNRSRRGALPTPPSGWPIGSYPTYAEAQRAVDYLSDQEFAVQDVTIVGVDLMQVERVLGRLTWAKVIGGGIVSGAWLGVFFGLLLGIVTGGFLGPLIVGIVRRHHLRCRSPRPSRTRRPVGSETSPRRCSWSPDVTTCCASRRRRSRPATCSPSLRSSRPAPLPHRPAGAGGTSR